MTRHEYFDAYATTNDAFKLHCDYYSQFVTPEIVGRVLDKIGKERIESALKTDKFLTNIPYDLWRGTHKWLPAMTRDKRKELNDRNSLSTTVCIAKQAARLGVLALDDDLTILPNVLE